MTNKMVMIIGVIGAFCFSVAASAHPLDMAYLQIVIEENKSVVVTVDVHPDIAKKIAGASDITAQSIFAAVFSSGHISLSEIPCELGEPMLTVKETIATVESRGTCGGTPDILQVSMPFIQPLGGGYQLLGRVAAGGREQFFRMTPNTTEVSLKLGAAPQFLDLVLMGVEHIGAWPSEWKSDNGGLKIPEGIDHILFVIALILGAKSLRGIILTAGGFTIGHSITLALALFQVVEVPSWLVEALIALSISIVAIESFFRSVSLRLKVSTATFFGLIHGLGFATALSILNLSDLKNTFLSLLGFNSGIELGQLIIILILGPLVFWAERKPFFRTKIKPAIAMVIFVFGIVWFFERI